MSALPPGPIVTAASVPAAPAPVDPLHALQAALQAPAGTAAQAAQLAALRAALEAAPGRIPLLAGPLIGRELRPGADSLLRRWVLDLIAFGLSRAPLAAEPRVQRVLYICNTRIIY
jgi:symplekin